MPTAKPAFDTPLDSGNALTAGIGLCAWCAKDDANPTRLTDVSGNALHGTLTGLDPAYGVVVTGGSGGGAVYNQTYTPNGTAYGKPTMLSADTSYICQYYYEMEPEMDGRWLLMPVAGDPSTDAVATKTGTGDAWGGTWSGGFSVAQGDPAPGPWFADGLQFGGGGYVDFGDIPDDHQPGTNDFTLIFDITNAAVVQSPSTLLCWYASPAGAPWIFIYNSGGLLHLNMHDGSAGVNEDFADSGTAFTASTRRKIGLSFDRSGYCRLTIGGTYVSQIDISACSGSLAGMNNCRVGTEWNAAASWAFEGMLNTGPIIYPATLLSDANHATIAGDIYALAQPATVALAGTAGAVASASGALGVEFALSGDATATADASGSLTLEMQLRGDAGAIASATGELTLQAAPSPTPPAPIKEARPMFLNAMKQRILDALYLKRTESGDVADLTTTAKTIVPAINEIAAAGTDVVNAAAIGTVGDLTTTATNLVGAVNEVKAGALPLAGGTLSGDLTITGGENIILSGTTGTKIGTATSQKLGFFNSTPVVQQANIAALKANYTTADLDTEAEIITALNATNTAFNDLLAKLKTLGLLASA